MMSEPLREDGQVEDLVADYIDRMNRGERLTVERVRAENPLLAEEVLDHLEAFVDLGGGDADAPLGTLGDYTLRRQIGRGGMGVVYEAWEISMNRPVALKVLPAGVAADTRTLTRFVREAQVAGSLHHPNVVTVYGMGVKEKTPYFAMELVEGETLGQVLARMQQDPALPGAKTPYGFPRDDVAHYSTVARSFADVADGLQHAHAKGIVHRDIKPSNLILDREGRLRILDFGLARLEGQESITVSGDFVGTPRYMSPEQARRQKVPIDHRTDVYSLGATLYEVLTLRPPFQGRDAQDTLSQIIERDPVGPRKLNPRIPVDLETIMLKCLRKEPADRYGTAEALGQDLRRFVRGDPIEARAETAAERFARRAWRSRWRIFGLAAVVLLAMTTIFLLLREQHQARLRREAAYGPKVLAAVLKMHSGPWSTSRVSGASIDPYGGLIVEADPETLETNPAIRPVKEALRDLGEAVALLPERPDAYYQRARAFLLLRRDDEALLELERSLAREPGFLPALITRSSVLERRGNPGGAREAMDEARRLAGDTISVIWLRAQEALSSRRWSEAEAAFGEVLQAGGQGDPFYCGSSIDSLMGRGIARLESRDYDGAIEDFARAEDRWPGCLEPSILKGKAYFASGRQGRAREEFKRLYEESSLKDEAALGIAAVFWVLWEAEEGLPWVQKLSSEVERNRQLASFLCDFGRFEEARAAALRTIQLNPREHLGRYFLAWGYLHEGKGRLDEAERRYREAIEIAPHIAGYRSGLAEVMWRERRLEEAVNEARGALKVDHKNSFAHVVIGLCLEAQNKLEEAGREFGEAVNVDPKNTDAWTHLGNFYHRTGRVEEAIAAHDRAIEAAPKNAWANLSRGIENEKLGRLDLAVSDYLAAAEGTPRDSVWQIHTAIDRLLGKLGRLPEAAGAYAKAFRKFPRDFELHRVFRQFLRRSDLAGAEAGLPDLVRALEDSLKSDGDPSLARQSLALLLSRNGKTKDAESAMRYLVLAREKAPANDRETALLSADVELACGRGKDAVLGLEEALAGAKWRSPIEGKLEECRRALMPDLASFASADAALARREAEAIVAEGAEWRFFRGRTEPSPGLEWTRVEFADEGWETGKSGFGYGDDDDATVLTEMIGHYASVYLRRAFDAPNPSLWEGLKLRVLADDGFVAWLNGVEVARNNVGADGEALSAKSITLGNAVEPLEWFQVKIDPCRLRPERNVLAIQGLNVTLDSSDFSLLPVLEGILRADDDAGARLLETFEPIASGDTGQAVLSYLEGRLLQLEDKHREAAAAFEGLISRDELHAEPLMRFAECLRALGDSAETELRLRYGLSAGLESDGAVWDSWITTCFVDLQWSPSDVLGVMPSTGKNTGPGTALRWLLERLARGEHVRINCGGGEYRAADGTVWGPDRFFTGGFRFGESNAREVEGNPALSGVEIAGTEDDILYQTERYFLQESSAPPGYRIPLPPGRYRVVLHFAEVVQREAGKRRFDVVMEGKPVLKDVEPLRAGFGTAQELPAEVSVTDGRLNIELVHRTDHPTVSAIEVVRID